MLNFKYYLFFYHKSSFHYFFVFISFFLGLVSLFEFVTFFTEILLPSFLSSLMLFIWFLSFLFICNGEDLPIDLFVFSTSLLGLVFNFYELFFLLEELFSFTFIEVSVTFLLLLYFVSYFFFTVFFLYYASFLTVLLLFWLILYGKWVDY